MIVVSNTSPLIALAKIDHLFVLSQLFEQILVPQIVVDEFQANSTTAEKQRLENFTSAAFKVVDKAPSYSFSRQLDAGEQAVLGLTLQQNIENVLIDDRKAFNEAIELGLAPFSTRSLLQVAVQRGFVKDFHELEARLQTKRFFMPNY